jgi:hypothetical protein
MTVQVTEVDIGFVKPKHGLIAFASVVLDDLHPIPKPVGLAIEHAIIEKLKNVLSKRRCYTQSY